MLGKRNYYIFLSLIYLINAVHSLNKTYEPSELVRQLHRLPHLNNHLSPVSNTFDLTVANRPWNEYTHSLVPFPTILASLGALGVFIFLSYLLVRSCGWLKEWGPDEIEGYVEDVFMLQRDSEGSTDLRRVLAGRNKAMRVFVVCLLVVIMCNQGIFIGLHWMDDAVSTFDDSLRTIKQTFAELTTQGNGLESAGLAIGDNLAAALPTCPRAANTLPVLQQYEDSVEAYLYLVSPIPDRYGGRVLFECMDIALLSSLT